MNGPEHYREAERLEAEGRQIVTAIKTIVPGEQNWREKRDDLGKQAMGIWAQAQVHATLALAAATALMQRPEPPGRDWIAWYSAAAAKPGKNEEASA